MMVVVPTAPPAVLSCNTRRLEQENILLGIRFKRHSRILQFHGMNHSGAGGVFLERANGMAPRWRARRAAELTLSLSDTPSVKLMVNSSTLGTFSLFFSVWNSVRVFTTTWRRRRRQTESASGQTQ